MRLEQSIDLHAVGTSEGAEKGWESRGRRGDKLATTAKLSRDPNTWKGKETAQLHVETVNWGGPGHSGALIALHEAGIPARRYPPGSMYENHVAVEVLKKHSDRASKVLWGK